MKKLFRRMFGGKIITRVTLVFEIFSILIFLYLFFMINLNIDRSFKEENSSQLQHAVSVCKLLLEEEKKQASDISLCVRNNMDKILDKGLAANPFPVDFIEIRDKEGQVIDSTGSKPEKDVVDKLLSGGGTGLEGTDITQIIPVPGEGISIISVFTFNDGEHEGFQIILGNNLSVGYIQEKISLEGFKVGIYSGNKKVAGDYPEMETLPGEIMDELEKNINSFDNFTINSLSVFTYPLKYSGGELAGVLLGSIPQINSVKKSLQDMVIKTILIGLFLALLSSFFISRIFFSSLEKLFEETEKIVQQEYVPGRPSIIEPQTEDFPAYLENMLSDANKRTEELKKSNEDLQQNRNQLEIVNLKLRKALEELEGFDKMKAQFLSNVSHEFRTPVALIISFAEILLSDGTASEEQKSLIMDIYNSSTRLKETVDNILALPDINGEKKDTKLLNANLHKIIEKIKKNFTSEIDKKELALKIDFSEKLSSPILCKPDVLEHVLNNLLSNAVKFTGKRGSITIKADIIKNNPYGVKSVDDQNKGNFLNISVTDTGIGIKPEDQRQIFQKDFWQADASSTRAYEGSGLGLIITKKLVEEIGGTIWFYSKEDEGSTFGFVIPVEHSEA